MAKTKIAATTVSIITVTQLTRSETIKLLAKHIEAQSYKHIVQWTIVEGSPTEEDANANSILINQLVSNVPITYINKGLHKLGQLRNIGNSACIGDITVCMDDDDYYFPTRVEHAVRMLLSSKCLIAGCSEKYMYNYELKYLYKFKSFGPNHSTNDCMAWKKEYLEKHSHDPNASNAEESSFTNKFSELMVQLDAKKCIVSSSHHMNTFDKKEICVLGTIGIHPKVTVIETQDLIKPDIFQKYCELYSPVTIESPYDIVYFTGGTSINWDPNDHSLGGSEQAVVHLCKEWVKLGKKVAVYGNVPNVTLDGVDYYDWKKFNYSAKYKFLIAWRMSGCNCLLPFDVKATNLYTDFHDWTFQFRFDYLKHVHKVHKHFFKSDFHVECYKKQFGLLHNDYTIVPNGIRVSDFKNNEENVVRNPFRFCYCSSYIRGLYELLTQVWPIIYKYEPRAELHVYYGMNDVQDQQFKQKMTFLLAQPGVMDHGRMPMNMIIREKWQSTFHLYITDSPLEIDCISVRESLVCGCIPLISKVGVFEKRDGLHFDMNYPQIANGILNLLQKPDFLEMVRKKFYNSPTIIDWETIAGMW